MKTSKKISVLVWGCNVTLGMLVLVLIASGLYMTLVPNLPELDETFEGATRFSAKSSQNFLSDYFHFERVIDKEKGIDVENYFFASTRDLYMIPVSDSVRVEAKKINSELSSTKKSWLGLKTKKVTVFESSDTLPVRLASPAIPLSKDKYKSLVQSNILYFILKTTYVILFFWFLRKFVSGLKQPDFFNQTNSRYLYIIAGIVTLSPFLIWAWTSWIRPDLYSEYQFENAEVIDTTSSLPSILLVFGLILFVIAWCFDHGVKLQKEQKLTV